MRKLELIRSPKRDDNPGSRDPKKYHNFLDPGDGKGEKMAKVVVINKPWPDRWEVEVSEFTLRNFEWKKVKGKDSLFCTVTVINAVTRMSMHPGQVEEFAADILLVSFIDDAPNGLVCRDERGGPLQKVNRWSLMWNTSDFARIFRESTSDSK